MNEKWTSNNFANDEFNHVNQDKEFKNLIIRLKEISKNITLLEKKIFK